MRDACVTQSDARRHMIGVRAGTLDDPEIGKPQMTIWTSSAPSWAVFDPNIQRDGETVTATAVRRGAPKLASRTFQSFGIGRAN